MKFPKLKVKLKYVFAEIHNFYGSYEIFYIEYNQPNLTHCIFSNQS